jgi:branched-chain amino acid transport system permease protein
MSTDHADGQSTGLWARWDHLKHTERFVILAAAGFVIVFPWLFVRSPIGEAISGYGSLARSIVIWSIFALGFNLLLGETGLLSFGHAMFWGLGGYMAAWVAQYFVDFPIAMLVGAVLISLVLASLAALVLLRLHTVYFAIVTLAIAQMMFSMAVEPAYALTGGTNGLTGVPVGDLLGTVSLSERLPMFLSELMGDYMYLLIAAGFVLTVAFIHRVLKSPYGLIFKGIRENETRTAFVGLSTWKYKFAAFLMSGAIAGLAGGLMTVNTKFVGVDSLFWTTSGDVVVMSVLGGLGTLAGPVIGAFVYLYFKGVVNSFETIGPFWQLMLATLFTVVVWRYSGGILGFFKAISRFLRRLTGAEETVAEPEAEIEGGGD